MPAIPPREISNFEFRISNLPSPSGISDFGFRISDLPSPICILLPEPPVGVALLRRASSRGPRGVVSWCASACQMAAYRGPQQRSVATAPWAAQPPRRPRRQKDRTRPRGIGVKRRFRDRDEIGPLGAFLRNPRRGRHRPRRGFLSGDTMNSDVDATDRTL